MTTESPRIAAEAARLLPLAQRVLKRYPFLTREVEHLATHSNVMYRVVTEAGQQLVLRVGSSRSNTRTNIDFEIAWLDALNRQTGLDVVTPMRTSGGALIVDEVDPEDGQLRPCVLFSWIPGEPLGDGAGSFGYRLMGQMSAALQEHGQTWTPPHMKEMRHWDQVFYYDPVTDPVVINDPYYDHLFPRARKTAISRAGEMSEKVISESWETSRPQVVHGDLHEWNVHVAGSRLYAFDFEDVMVALPAQDVAVSLYSSRRSEQREGIRAAFRKGFETIGEWPVVDEAQLDAFHAARQIMLMNYAARTLPVDEAADFIDAVMPWLDGYVRRYG